MTAAAASDPSTCAWFDANYPAASAFPADESGALLCMNTLTSHIKAVDATSGPDPYRGTRDASEFETPLSIITTDVLDIWGSLQNICTDGTP